MTLTTMDIEGELALAAARVTALSERLEDEARFVEEADLRMTLLFAEAEGEVVTSAPPVWVLAA